MPEPDERLTAAMAAHRAGRLADAESGYRELLEAEPDNVGALNMLGALCLEIGRADEALRLLLRAVELAPESANARNNLAAALGRLGRHDEAAEQLRQAVGLVPSRVDFHRNLGLALEKAGRLREAREAYLRGIALRADDVELYSRLGGVVSKLGRTDEAEAVMRRMISLRPEDPHSQHGLAVALLEQGRAAEAVAALRRRAALLPHAAAAHSDLLYALHYVEPDGSGDLYREHCRWAERHAGALAADASPPAGETPRRQRVGAGMPGRRLRVGYVSRDFRWHSIARFFEPLLRHHDRGRFETHCFSDAPEADEVTERLKGTCDGWHETAGIDDAELAERIRSADVDILVDLAGHGAGGRLLVFARKPAPVQVSYLGYPDTTGLRSIDWRITDGLADPRGLTEAFYTERLVRLPRCAWCYQPDADSPAVGGAPAGTKGFVTFGCLNNVAKVTPAALSVWAAVLAAVPASRLVIAVPGDPAHQTHLRHALGRAGIPDSLSTLAGRTPTRFQYLERYHQIDIALDPFPYAGTTTTCDALWMGVPTVTLAGQTHVSRTGVSLLTAVGLPELIARTPDEYVRVAAGLASDLPRLAALRAGLRQRVARSALSDGAGLAAAIEAAYVAMERR